MSYRRLRITAADRALHGAFFAHVTEVFPGIDFRRWGALDGWTSEYHVLAWGEADRIVASIGCTRMPLIVDGRERAGLQLGAVATRADHRGRGLARMLMDDVLAEADRELMPVFLFANSSVLDFYPRFGFQRVVQGRFGGQPGWGQAAGRAQPFNLADAKARRRLAELCARAMPTGRGFGTRSYYPILLWHLCNRPLTGYWLEPDGAFAVTESVRGRLILHDIIALMPVDLAAVLPALTPHSAVSVECGFEPSDWWPDSRPLGPDDALLFVRGVRDLPAAPFRFPDLAQT